MEVSLDLLLSHVPDVAGCHNTRNVGLIPNNPKPLKINQIV